LIYYLIYLEHILNNYLKYILRPCTVAHACNSSYIEDGEIRRLEVKGQAGNTVCENLTSKMTRALEVWLMRKSCCFASTKL
jgi:hypothetical protein